VHYVSYGTPGGEYTSQCRAAIITEVPLVDEARTPELRAEGEALVAAGRIGLAVVNPSGMFFKEADYHGGDPDHVDATPDRPTYRSGTWHWPERV
jgi:hypothetical protein